MIQKKLIKLLVITQVVLSLTLSFHKTNCMKKTHKPIKEAQQKEAIDSTKDSTSVSEKEKFYKFLEEAIREQTEKEEAENVDLLSLDSIGPFMPVNFDEHKSVSQSSKLHNNPTNPRDISEKEILLRIMKEAKKMEQYHSSTLRSQGQQNSKKKTKSNVAKGAARFFE